MKNGSPKKTKADELATTVQRVGIGGGIFRLIRALGLAALLVVLAVFLLRAGLPFYVGLGLVVIALGIVLFEIITLKRISAVDLDSVNDAADSIAEPEPDEVLMGSIPAVMQYGKVRSVEFMGAGKVLLPENALIITNKAIWALTVPLSGTDKVVSGADIGKWQWMSAYEDIVVGLKELVSTLPLDELLKRCRARRLMSRDELKSATAQPANQAISLLHTNGEKYSYSIRRQEDYQKAIEILPINITK